MAADGPDFDFESFFRFACGLPYCKIDREAFLTNELKNRVDPAQLADALANGTVAAKIPIHILVDIAGGSIAYETRRVSLLSTLAGIPGGLVMIGTVSADFVQFYVHVFRIAQKLAYIYGAKDLNLSDGTQGVLMLYLGVMLGVDAASAALVKFAAAHAVKIGAKVAAKPLTKYAIYNIAKKILAWIGVKLTKDAVGKAVAKAIPLAGGLLSGGLTVATYLPMANALQNELSKFAAMSPEDLAEASAAADEILAEFVDTAEAPSIEEGEDVNSLMK